MDYDLKEKIVLARNPERKSPAWLASRSSRRKARDGRRINLTAELLATETVNIYKHPRAVRIFIVAQVVFNGSWIWDCSAIIKLAVYPS